MGGFMKSEMIRIAERSDFKIELLEVDKDHLHMLIDSVPSISVTSIVRRLKQKSTISIWKIHANFLRNHFWNEKTFWTDGYFVSTIGEVSEETVRKYIENQG
jgi:putative transposase